MRALGLIEVMGLPGAIEAADAALKAASVTLLNVAKVGSGIMTVEITGGVDAVTAAVEAGALSASRITTLRAKHVIPRMDDSLMQTVVPWKVESQKEQPVARRTIETHPSQQQAEGTEFSGQEAEGADFPGQQSDGEEFSRQEDGAEFPHQEAEGAEFPHQKSEEDENSNQQAGGTISYQSEGDQKPHHEAEMTIPHQNSDKTEAEGAEFPHQQAEETKNADMNPSMMQTDTGTSKSGVSKESKIEELAKLSNSQLRSKIHEYGITVPEEELKRLKKQELVNVLERHLKEIKEKGE